MEYSKALTFIWEDPRWQQKLLIGVGVVIASTVLSVVLIGLLGFLIVMGYCVRLLQNVRAGHPHPLPEWDEWGEDLARGFKLFIVSIVWALPAILLTIPSGVGGAMAGASSEGVQAFGTLISVATACLSFLYGLFLAAVTPGFTIAFAEDEQITSGLQFRDILAWTQDNIGQVIVVTLLYLIASFAFVVVGSIVGVLLCLVGLILTIPAATLVAYLFQYHLFGQLAYAYPFSGGTRASGFSSTATATGASSSSVAPIVTTTPATTPPPATSEPTASDLTSSSTPPAAPEETAPDVPPGMEPPIEGDASESPGSGSDEQPKP